MGEHFNGQEENEGEDNFIFVDDFFSTEEYARYSRQMSVPNFGGVDGQKRIKNSRVLIIGAGGLGCPAALYLAGAGVGEIGISDGDSVDLSNLHRQIIYNMDSIGKKKVDCVEMAINKLNSHVKVKKIPFMVKNENAFEIISKFDFILDCTDRPQTRYLINDVSVLCKKTLVCGSGLKSNGQFSVFNFNNQGPCYRCFFPKPPLPEHVGLCSEEGVIGPMIGIVGNAMAFEVMKLILGQYSNQNFEPFIGIYSGYPQRIEYFKMRNKSQSCEVCSINPNVTKEKIESLELNYDHFCQKKTIFKLSSEHRINVKQYCEIRKQDVNMNNHLVIDVRPQFQFQILRLKKSINIDWNILKHLDNIDAFIPPYFNNDEKTIYVICRHGIDSQVAVKKLIEDMNFTNVKDIVGGISKWNEFKNEKIPIL